MFGSLTITLDKAVWLAGVATALAICASMILKSGIELLIKGDSGPNQQHTRKKGAILTIVSLALLTASIVAIIENENLATFLSTRITDYKKTIQSNE